MNRGYVFRFRSSGLGFEVQGWWLQGFWVLVYGFLLAGFRYAIGGESVLMSLTLGSMAKGTI